MNYFRAQGKNITLEQMKTFKSESGADEDYDDFDYGVCASDSPGPRSFGGAWDALNEDDEIVVFKGQLVKEIYDGYIVYPTQEIARFTIREWREKLADGSAYDYEEW